MGPNGFFGVTFCYVEPLARLRGGMAAETETLKLGMLHKLSTGKWFVHCKWCETETRLETRNEEDAYAMLVSQAWRLSMPRRHSKYRNWSCPACVREYWNVLEPTTTETAETAATDAAGSAGQLADQRMQRASFDALQLEVVALKAEVVELKKEVERLKAEAHEHVAYQAAHDEELLARALQMVRREVRRRAVPDDTRDVADIAVPDEPEETSHEC